MITTRSNTTSNKIQPPPNVYISNDVTDEGLNDSLPSPYLRSPIDGSFQSYNLAESSYIKPHKNLTFSYVPYFNTLQHGTLGRSDSFLMGTLHLNYEKYQQVKSIDLNFKGYERTSWTKTQGRTKFVYSGEHIIANKHYRIWSSPTKDETEILNLDVPFKVRLPYDLPDTLKTHLGEVYYSLRAIVNLKGSLISSTHTVEIHCPLKRTLVLDSDNSKLYKFHGESESITYTFVLPPAKNVNIGVYISIPMRIRFLRPGISIERIELAIKTNMKFRCNTNNTCKVSKRSGEAIIPRQELQYLNPIINNVKGDCIKTISFWIPRETLPTYYGRYITISHVLCIKIILLGIERTVHIEESINIANIQKSFDVELPPPPAPPRFLNPKAFSLYLTTCGDRINYLVQNSIDSDSISFEDRDVEAAAAIVTQLYQSHIKKRTQSLSDEISSPYLYDG
ncbi:arrestin domain-containing protein 2 isoform x2 [Gigaspora margarita]|nr:arrestin domain-containing protein 2 isoform x2 [Gigaspora margarita]